MDLNSLFTKQADEVMHKTVGEDCELPYEVSDGKVIISEWKHCDKRVLTYRDDKIDENLQDESFRNRVELVDPFMTSLNVGIKLQNLTLEDAGRYFCEGLIQTPDNNREFFAHSFDLFVSEQITQATVLLTVRPNRQHFSRWDAVSLSCSSDDTGSWDIMRDTSTAVESCGVHWGKSKGSVCKVEALVSEDSGLYWCERDGHRSAPVRITVHKDFNPVMDLVPTSVSETPPPSTEAPPPSSQTPPLSQRTLGMALLCHLLVLCPYVVSTALLVSLCRHTRSEDAPPPVTRDYDITGVVTEYDF
ncbi:hypothetical protein WMY93_014781 [Mugilogobius chulae]|uniref:Immunoglobulin domain-containing protein n=1 Tax=Mugilogobius chulae TaxID=88201 RepID=A0AAW0NVW8_9GOBI